MRAPYESSGVFRAEINVEWREVEHLMWRSYKEALQKKTGVAIPPPLKVIKEKKTCTLKVQYVEWIMAKCQCIHCKCGGSECWSNPGQGVEILPFDGGLIWGIQPRRVYMYKEREL